MRPQAIVRFELFYLASIVLTIVATWLSWDMRMAQATANPQVAALGAMVPAVAMGTVAIGVLIGLLLWFFVARRGSNVAKWIATALFVLGALRTLAGLASGAFDGGLAMGLALVGVVCEGVAIAMLFTPGAAPWFARGVPADPVE